MRVLQSVSHLQAFFTKALYNFFFHACHMLHPPVPLWPAILITSCKKQKSQDQLRYQNPNDGWSPPQNRWYLWTTWWGRQPDKVLLKSGNSRHSSLSNLRSPRLSHIYIISSASRSLKILNLRSSFSVTGHDLNPANKREKLYFRIF